MSETFSEADLAPSPEERRAKVALYVDRFASTVAVLSAAAIVGGLIALGACAAPFVFRITPAPYSGDAMGAAFARFDRFAIGGCVVMLGAEIARTFIARRDPRSAIARIRRLVSIAFSACVVYVAATITPAINDLHRAGAVRGEGTDGQRLAELHGRAEFAGKVEAGLGLLIVALHVFTPKRRPEDEEHFVAPGIPGGG
ncbi:MAG: DUF4149 domain-containing protein [Polyangiaceae bacterium]